MSVEQNAGISQHQIELKMVHKLVEMVDLEHWFVYLSFVPKPEILTKYQAKYPVIVNDTVAQLYLGGVGHCYAWQV